MFYWMVHHTTHGYVEQQFDTIEGLKEALEYVLANGWDIRCIKVMNGNQEAQE